MVMRSGQERRRELARAAADVPNPAEAVALRRVWHVKQQGQQRWHVRARDAAAGRGAGHGLHARAGRPQGGRDAALRRGDEEHARRRGKPLCIGARGSSSRQRRSGRAACLPTPRRTASTTKASSCGFVSATRWRLRTSPPCAPWHRPTCGNEGDYHAVQDLGGVGPRQPGDADRRRRLRRRAADGRAARECAGSAS